MPEIENPAFLPLRELARRMRQGELSPVVLAEAVCDRLEAKAPRYNALVTLTRERALAEARTAEREIRAGRIRGALQGIPYGAKDLLATGGGIPTSWGLAAFRDQQFSEDAGVIERLGQAGAVLAGKLAMVELAGGMRYNQPNASFSGPGKTPWNDTAWSGGSSSGSGAAVAAGLVPFAIGTETMGSITLPAAFCGLSGLRPTLGRVTRRGAMALSWTLDKIGPMCHSADDCGLVLEAIAGRDEADDHTVDRPFGYTRTGLPKRRLKLRVLKADLNSGQAEPRNNFRAVLEQLKPIADVEEVDLPPHPYATIIQVIILAEASAALGDRITDAVAQQLVAEETRAIMAACRTIPARDYINCLRARERMHAELGAWMEGCDAVVAPTAKKVAPPLDARLSEYFGADRRTEISALSNLLGWPALTVPNGFGERGLPTAVQFVGAPFSENLLLALGNHYQEQTDWHTRHPQDL